MTTNKVTNKRWLFGLSFLFCGLDFASKHWVVAHIPHLGTYPHWPESLSTIFQLTHVHNTGIAFSMLNHLPVWGMTLMNAGLLLVFITLACFGNALNLFSLPAAQSNAPTSRQLSQVVGMLPMAMIIGGALGNLLDRLQWGYVVDFIELTFMEYPIFNVADACIVTGAILLMLYQIADLKKSPVTG